VHRQRHALQQQSVNAAYRSQVGEGCVALCGRRPPSVIRSHKRSRCLAWHLVRALTC